MPNCRFAEVAVDLCPCDNIIPYETVVCKGEGGYLTALIWWWSSWHRGAYLVLISLPVVYECLAVIWTCLLLCSPEYIIFKFEVRWFSCYVNLLASQHHTHARVTPKKVKCRKIYHTLPWWLHTAVKCTRVADYHPKNTVHYRGGWVPR